MVADAFSLLRSLSAVHFPLVLRMASCSVIPRRIGCLLAGGPPSSCHQNQLVGSETVALAKHQEGGDHALSGERALSQALCFGLFYSLNLILTLELVLDSRDFWEGTDWTPWGWEVLSLE